MIEASYRRGYLLEDFRLFHLTGVPEESIDYHYHEFHKIFLLCDGSGNYSVNGCNYTLRSGDVVLIGSRCVHRPEFDCAYDRLIIYISPDYLRSASTAQCNLDELFTFQPVLHPSHQEVKRLFSLASELEQTLSEGQYGSDILSHSLLLQLLVALARNHAITPTTPPVLVSPSDMRIAEILKYIDANLTEALTIDSIAEHFFISKYHMMRLFRQETGKTIHAYIQECRLFNARTLIGQGIRATEACYRSGFHSYSAFTRAYGQRFGTTPTGRTPPVMLIDETYE